MVQVPAFGPQIALLRCSLTKTREEISAAYKSEPWWYDVRGFLILTFAYNSTLGKQLRFFGPNFGPNHLEVACGTGTLTELFLRWRRWKKLPTSHVVGIDYAPSMLAGAMRRFAGRSDIEFVHGDVADMPFEDGHFDTANVANAIHCFPEVDASLREIFRVLKSGGTMAANVLLFPKGWWPFSQIATSINQWGIAKGILVTPYKMEDIRAGIISAGYEIVSEEVFGNCYEVRAKRPA